MRTRLAGGLLVGSVVALFAWRLVIVEAILGPIDPAEDLPAPERALLAVGLLAGSILATIGLTLLARQLRPTGAGRWAVIGQYACQAAPAVLAIGMLGLLVHPAFQTLFTAFAALTTGSWVIFGLALWRVGLLRWLGLLTAFLGVAMLILILAGAFIIFIMFGALLPLGLGLLLRRQPPATEPVRLVGSPIGQGHATGR
jgi:hypothetical protein